MDPSQLYQISNNPKLSFLDASLNEFVGSFDLDFLNGIYLFYGNPEMKIENFQVGGPISHHFGVNNSIFECKSVYSRNALKSNVVDGSNQVKIDQQNYDYTGCECSENYFVNFFFFLHNFFIFF